MKHDSSVFGEGDVYSKYPYTISAVNSAPEGPFSANLPDKEKNGMTGTVEVKHRGETFHFK